MMRLEVLLQPKKVLNDTPQTHLCVIRRLIPKVTFLEYLQKRLF